MNQVTIHWSVVAPTWDKTPPADYFDEKPTLWQIGRAMEVIAEVINEFKRLSRPNEPTRMEKQNLLDIVLAIIGLGTMRRMCGEGIANISDDGKTLMVAAADVAPAPQTLFWYVELPLPFWIEVE